jgi:uncharacterized membrane protein
LVAGIDWHEIDLAGAFVVGAILATIATLRVVRAVAVMFGGEIRRARRTTTPDRPGDGPVHDPAGKD